MLSRAWFPFRKPPPSPQVRLVCLPYAGGGASLFRPLGAALPPEVELCAAQLPGRENRLREPPLPSLPALAVALADALCELPPLPLVIFGHSMGALLAYELARTLEQRGTGAPAQVVVSGHAPPHVPQAHPSIHGLSDADFLGWLTRLGGMRPEILAEPELMKLLLPLLRADFTASEGYAPAIVPLRAPLRCFYGEADPHCTPAGAQQWAGYTLRFEGTRAFAGDHFFFFGPAGAPARAALAELCREVSPVG